LSTSATDESRDVTPVVLLAGRVSVPDRIGHHDYLAGCNLLADLVAQTPGVRPRVVCDGWPEDESVFDDARSVVVYSGGRQKLALTQTPQRLDLFQMLADRGVGMVMIHQAGSFSPALEGRAAHWICGVHIPGKSGSGHWPSLHGEFPEHPVTRGVASWAIKDGWLNRIQFADGARDITPVVWSGREHRGSSKGGLDDVVSWAYERPGGGRAFCFSGLDAHSTWSKRGVRQLLVNAIIWSAGLPIPESGAPCAADEAALPSYLTPRGSRGQLVLKLLERGLRKLRR